MNTEKYLPIGSVVLLKNATKRIMITGFAVQGKEEPDKIYDYIGCLYPEGVMSSEQNLVFDHSQIEKIYYIGYSDDEWKNWLSKMKEALDKMETAN